MSAIRSHCTPRLRRFSATAAAIAVGFLTSAASAGIVVYGDESVGGVGDLVDWNYDSEGDNLTLMEEWAGQGPVGFYVGDAQWAPANYEGGGGFFEITIDKTLVNSTDFSWSAFDIDFTPRPGATAIEVVAESVTSDHFSDVSVFNNEDGSANIHFELDGVGDTAVGFGEEAHFSMTILVFGDIAFNMVQTPIPAPGALALLGLAGLLGVQRKRRR